MIERTRKPEAITKILLDPSMSGVFDAYAHKLPVVVRNPKNICFTDGLRVCLFVAGRKHYHFIVGMLPEGRGAGGIDFARHCLLEVMEGTREAIVFSIHASNKAAVQFAKDLKMGFELSEADGIVWGELEARAA
jgi:hypothetical protein